jgi:hypothetical protein
LHLLEKNMTADRLVFSDPRKEQGFIVELRLMHGSADAFTTHIRKFPITQATELQRYLQVLEAFGSADLDAFSDSESLSTELGSRTQLPQANVLQWLLEGIHLSDAVFGDESTAQPAAYRVARVDASGLSYALYPDMGHMLRYKLISPSVSPSYFRDWA